MANNLKSAIDRWSTEAVENTSRRVALLAIGVGLVVIGIVLIAASGDTNTYHVYSCDSTGQCSWSMQHPSILASLSKFGGMVAIAIGGLLLISFGMKMYKKMTSGTREEAGAIGISGEASFTSGEASPTPPATVVTRPPHVGVTRSTPTAGGVGPVGPGPVSQPGDAQPSPRLKGKLAK